jgi:hypothetical protein
MTPREHRRQEEQEKGRLKKLSEKWICPLSNGGRLLHAVMEEMDEWSLNQGDVPLIIKLIENPKYKSSKLFTGAVSLFNHDCIHVVLGRGILPKDEAFVIGYTMGSSKKMKRWRRNLFMFAAKYLYPKEYSFGEEERFVFNVGVMMGSLCPSDLSQISFNIFSSDKIDSIRKKLGVEKKLLKHYYEIEKKCFPNGLESQRLL